MNHADLELSIASKRADPLTAVVLRPLDFADIDTENLPKQTKPVAIKKIRANHRHLAKLIASGMKQSECAIICGLTDSRVSILLTDPMFSQLVRMYADEADEQFRNMNRKMADLGEDIIDDLADKFDADPDTFSMTDKKDLLKLLADRTGNGPATATVNVNVNSGIAERMEAARARASLPRPQGTDMKDITPAEAAE